jgi:cell division septation protein DedD
MPQGSWTMRNDARGMGVGGQQAAACPKPIAAPAPRWRSGLALSLLALTLAAGCAQQAAQPGAQLSGYNRPASYDPPGPPGDPWGPWIRDASRRHDVPERWIREVMRQESGGRVGATSPVGAMGLMQVMPGTYRELRARYGLGDDPYHPYDSIMAGTAYIREMYDLYGSPAFLAAYNAGPRRLEDYLWNGRGLPTETRNYVRRIGPRIAGTHPHRRVSPEVYAAAEIPLDIQPGPRRMDPGTMMALRQQRESAPAPIEMAALPPGPVVRMDPIASAPAASPIPAPQPAYQVAALGATVIRMDPIPDGSTYAQPLPPPAEAMRQAPAPDPRPVRGSSLTAAPLPAPAARQATPPVIPASRLAALAPAQAARPGSAPQGRPVMTAAAPPQPAAPGSRFGVLGTTQAATVAQQPALRPAAAPASAAGSAGWGVQIGAFSSEAQARSAAAAARGNDGRAVVQPVAQGRATLYRARVMGLSRSAAQQLCDRLRSRGGCTLVSPEG